MSDEEKGFEVVESGLEFVRGGHGCFCSPGGYEYGRDSDCGCACGCLYSSTGGSSPQENHSANMKKVGLCDPFEL